jgi:hypothetical protein
VGERETIKAIRRSPSTIVTGLEGHPQHFGQVVDGAEHVHGGCGTIVGHRIQKY